MQPETGKHFAQVITGGHIDLLRKQLVIRCRERSLPQSIVFREFGKPGANLYL